MRNGVNGRKQKKTRDKNYINQYKIVVLLLFISVNYVLISSEKLNTILNKSKYIKYRELNMVGEISRYD